MARYKYVTANNPKTGKRYSRPEHDVIWEKHYGIIPDDCIIHHVNGDGLDNRIENLEMVTRQEHPSLHSKYKHECDGKGKYRCSKCGRWLRADCFYKSDKGKFGLQTPCKECHSKSVHHWQDLHRDKTRDDLRAWRARNPDKVAEQVKRSEKSRKKWYVEHKEQVKIYMREYMRARRAKRKAERKDKK